MKRRDVPIYIVSKGRAESRLTGRALDAMGVPHFMVIEKQEFEAYAKHVDPKQLLVLDPKYQRDYDTFDYVGEKKGPGPGPARNFSWDHAISLGAEWHWVMDDNIRYFYRLNRNQRIPLADGTGFDVMERFCDRYVNVAMAGPFYHTFAHRREAYPPFIVNTRIYSCNLIRNAAPFRWRGRYNEDTDLSLRMLKAGWATVQFYAYLQGKVNTQTLKGGNTAEFYAKEGTWPKSRMQVVMHPDVSELVWKFRRWHHVVDYGPFKNNPLIPKPGARKLPPIEFEIVQAPGAKPRRRRA